MSHHKPDPNKSVNLTIDGMPVTVPEGTTILEAARKVNVNIPALCNYSGLGKRAVCRICVVECDGRGKLVPACANDVWEGVSVVTNSLRILNIRRTIIELLLNDHPPECLGCVKNKKCELQTLAAAFGVRETPFRHSALDRRPPETENKILVRDMSKCVKCGRCVEVCQEVQTARAINSSGRSINYEICAPYSQALNGGSCIFCGQCAEVCPVGAIFENDQTKEIETALNNKGLHVAALIAPAVAAAISDEFEFPPGTITNGKLASALKRIGFSQVFDAASFADIAVREESQELLDRVKNPGNTQCRMPMITGCSPALKNFIGKFYPDLTAHLPAGKSPGQLFRTLLRDNYPRLKGTEASKIISVSVMPCIANKGEAQQPGAENSNQAQTDFSLTPRELAEIIKIYGLDLANLPETPFDEFPFDSQGGKGAAGEILGRVYEAYSGKLLPPPVYKETQNRPGIKEAEADLQGTRVKILYIDSPAHARPVLDAVRKGECDAAFIEINCCSMNGVCIKTQHGGQAASKSGN